MAPFAISLSEGLFAPAEPGPRLMQTCTGSKIRPLQVTVSVAVVLEPVLAVTSTEPKATFVTLKVQLCAPARSMPAGEHHKLSPRRNLPSEGGETRSLTGHRADDDLCIAARGVVESGLAFSVGPTHGHDVARGKADDVGAPLMADEELLSFSRRAAQTCL